MYRIIGFHLLATFILVTGCNNKNDTNSDTSTLFPPELVDFIPIEQNPVFQGTGTDTWDKNIRERGYILKEDDGYKMWYTGFNANEDPTMYLGYATSDDGIQWTRHAGNPIFDEYWTEDVHVVKHEGRYYMVAEGVDDIAHMLTSDDGIHWQRQGDLDIRKVNGDPIDPGAYGTPTLWIEDDNWYLLYERGDLGIWLAVSADHKVWTNVQDDPVIELGPGAYDAEGVAINQVIKYQGRYYAYYHGTPDEDWSTWNSNVAVSDDLIHWTKYDKNPIMTTVGDDTNISSPILVHDGKQYRLYTMHKNVRVYNPNPAN
jgi:hypothetical protein